MHFDSLFHYCPVCGSGQWEKRSVKSMQCLDCGFVMYINPSAAVAVFIYNETGQLLVGIRGKEPEIGTFDLPGGFVDDFETAEEALIREIKEETSLDVISCNYLFSLPNSYTYSGWTLPTLDLFYEARIEALEGLKESDDVESLRWMDVNMLNPNDFGLSSIRKAVEIIKTRNVK